MSPTNIDKFDESLTNLKKGSIIIKQKRSGEKFFRRFFLDENQDYISYEQSDKVFAQPRRYYIRDIDEVRRGFHTLACDGNGIDSEHEEFGFSIFYHNYRAELHLIPKDQQTRDLWMEGLQYLIDFYAKQRQRYLIRDDNWILSHLRFADKDQSNTMNKDECRKLLTDSLNIELSEENFEKLYREADRNKQGFLNPDDFVRFFQLLARRNDLFQIMQKYVENGDQLTMETISMNINELFYFLNTIQKQKLLVHSSKQFKNDFTIQSITKREQIQELINQFELNVQLKKNGRLSLDGFRNLMLADEFSLVKPWCVRRPYQDMTRPLTDYFINSSHNTYLFQSQVSGRSNPEAYNRVLRAGCRVVEIDCYDGDDGQPIVTHGFTFIEPCSFLSVIQIIKPNLFRTSPYPVIISIENHCSDEQQKEIARILKEVLGEYLVTEFIQAKNPSVLPSPEELKYKVLIRSAKVTKPISDQNLSDKSAKRILEGTSSDLFIYLQNVPYHPNKSSTDRYSYFNSSSLSENQLEDIAQSDPTGLLNRSTKHLLRMYPDGLRQDSSNPNPILAWNFGIQMVALNYQNTDQIMSLCYGKFLDNGLCGYILKPNYLIYSHQSNYNPLDYFNHQLLKKDYLNHLEYPQRLILTILSGQFLSRSNKKIDDIPDPYVQISIHGLHCDEQMQKTKFIENNGFNPEWNETFVFEIYFPQMCLIRFDVYDYDIFSKDDRIAYFCLPMTMMQTGYRHVQLKSKDHDSTFSSLFIHVATENLSD